MYVSLYVNKNLLFCFLMCKSLIDMSEVPGGSGHFDFGGPGSVKILINPTKINMYHVNFTISIRNRNSCYLQIFINKKIKGSTST